MKAPSKLALPDLALRSRALAGRKSRHLVTALNLPAESGGKATRLGQASQAGLPVPPFWMLPEESLRSFIRQNIVREIGDEIHIPDPEALASVVLPANPPALLAVRSAFSAEDTESRSFAGHFESVLHVSTASAHALAEALRTVWQSASREAQVTRRDVVLMSMVAARKAGVAFLETDFQTDLVNFTTGTAERLVAGVEQGQRVELNRNSSASQGDIQAHWLARLQTLIRQVRRCFGEANWDIEWADDGQRCWLLQVRPITRRTLRDEVFTMANHREILPDPPSWFMTTLIAGSAQGLFAYYRAFDARLPEQRPFIEILHGRPLINLSLLLDMMRLWGLPSRLVTDSIGGSPGDDTGFGLNLAPLLRSLPALLRQGLEQLRAPGRARSTASELVRRATVVTTKAPEAGSGLLFSPLVDEAAAIYVQLVQAMFALTSAISGPSTLLRKAGVLATLSRRQRSASTRMYDELRQVAIALGHTPSGITQLEQGLLPTKEPFASAWRQWLKAHGHRGIYESDLAMPRFHEKPESLFPALLSTASGTTGSSSLPLVARVLWPVWQQARAAIAAREGLRADAMQAFDLIRQSLLQLARRAAEAGVLPTPEHLWLLSAEECRRLDQGWIPDEVFWQQRASEQSRRASLQVPNIVRRFEALPGLATTNAVGGTTWQGIGLCGGTAAGRALVASRPLDRLPTGFTPQSTILVARAVDPGWIPTFSLACAVVVEIGGDLSHGSIILRELGLPSVTNVEGICSAVQSGDLLHVEAGQGLVILRSPSAR